MCVVFQTFWEYLCCKVFKYVCFEYIFARIHHITYVFKTFKNYNFAQVCRTRRQLCKSLFYPVWCNKKKKSFVGCVCIETLRLHLCRSRLPIFVYRPGLRVSMPINIGALFYGIITIMMSPCTETCVKVLDNSERAPV